jgi:transposase
VLLPSESPHLHPIEQVWKQLKWTMSAITVHNEREFYELVKDVFDQVTQRRSFAKKR